MRRRVRGAREVRASKPYQGFCTRRSRANFARRRRANHARTFVRTADVRLLESQGVDSWLKASQRIDGRIVPSYTYSDAPTIHIMMEGVVMAQV